MTASNTPQLKGDLREERATQFFVLEAVSRPLVHVSPHPAYACFPPSATASILRGLPPDGDSRPPGGPGPGERL